MNVQVEINIDTLETTSTDEELSIFNVVKEGNIVSFEVSKPDPQPTESTILP